MADLTQRPVLALDIGGTKLAAAVVEPDGRPIATDRAPTRANGAPDALFDDLIALGERVLAQAGVPADALGGIGVGCGGPMVYPEGRVSPLNIPAWRDFPLRERLAAHYGRPTRVDNDAKAFALGEHWLGAGRGARCLLGMVVSTGVGGGIVEEGRLIHGARGNAGHIGHVVVFPNGPRCACGANGCVEAIASGTGLARRAVRARARGNGVAHTPDHDPRSPAVSPRPSGAEVVAAAKRGNPTACRLVDEAGLALGRGIAAAATLLDVDRVVIGGGVALGAGELLLEPARRELARNARLDFARDVDLVLSELGVAAALAGAAALILRGSPE